MKVIQPSAQHDGSIHERQDRAYNRFAHKSPGCKGCSYGDRQYCVGICWKKVYESVLNRKRITENSGES